MATRNLEAVWEGNLNRGKEAVNLRSGTYRGADSFASRFESGSETNPEELIAGAEISRNVKLLGR